MMMKCAVDFGVLPNLGDAPITAKSHKSQRSGDVNLLGILGGRRGGFQVLGVEEG